MMIIYKLCIKMALLLFLFGSSFAVTGLATNRQALEEKIRQIAEGKQLGYKTANLYELENLSLAFNKRKHAYKIAVPAFVGIPSEKVQAFLFNHGGFDIAAAWEEIIRKHFIEKPRARESAQSTHSFTDEFLFDSAAFCVKLKSAFNVFISSINDESVSLDKLFETADIDSLLRITSHQKEVLMVRSSGKEDTPYLANAGGNVSIANVRPTSMETLKAIRDVVVSYFEPKSLKQRLGADDPSLFELEAFTPALIQRMIGENANMLSKCGVMFTEEAEGGISRYHDKSDKSGRIETTGITVIQAAYGHNEGVVNSLIPIDTFYVDKNYFIYPVIRPKTYRLKPVVQTVEGTEKRLEMVPNDPALAKVPALNKAAVITLKGFGDELEEHYLRPMDVEFVVNEQKKTIYIVQARPIVHKKGLPDPSYLIDPTAISSAKKIVGQAIGVAGGSLRWCGPGQMVIGSTINEALSKYQNKDIVPDSSIIQCIVVGKMAPATSHEATTFRSEGKPVLFTEQWQTVENWAKQPNNKILMSPQQNLIINWDAQQNSLNEIVNDPSLAATGWYSYPVSSYISISQEFAPDQKLENIINDLIAALPRKSELKEQKEQLSWEEFHNTWKLLIGSLRDKTAEEALLELILFLSRISPTIEYHSKGLFLEPYQRQIISLLKQYTAAVAISVKNNLQYTKKDPGQKYILRLLPIRFLENILNQDPLFDQVVDAYSLKTLFKRKLLPEQKVMQEIREAGFVDKSPDGYDTRLLAQLLQLREITNTSELAQNWKNFLFLFFQNADDRLKISFRNLIAELGTLKMLPVWLATSFAQAYEKYSKLDANPSKIISIYLIEEYDASKAFLKQLQEKMKTLNAFNVGIFADPKNYDEAWPNFEQGILSYFLSDHFAGYYKQANNLGKLAAVSITTKFVNDVFDLSIKALTGSTLYERGGQKQLDRFAEMLRKYYALLDKLVNFYNTEGLRLNWEVDQKILQILNLSKQKKPRIFTAEDLKSSPNLNVPHVAINGGAFKSFYDAHEIKTLEDVFQIIHQSILFILGRFGYVAGLKDIQVPSLLNKVENVILTGGKHKAYLVLINLLPASIVMIFNQPLRDHSAQYEVDYEKKSKRITVRGRFYGDDEHDRWQKIEAFIQAMNLNKIFQVSNIKRTDVGIKFEITFNNEEAVDIFSFVYQMCDHMTFYFPPIYSKIFPIIEKLLGFHTPVSKFLSIAESFVKSTFFMEHFQGVTLFKSIFEKFPEETKRKIEEILREDESGIGPTIVEQLKKIINETAKGEG